MESGINYVGRLISRFTAKSKRKGFPKEEARKMNVGDTDFNKIIEFQYLNNQADAYFHLNQD